MKLVQSVAIFLPLFLSVMVVGCSGNAGPAEGQENAAAERRDAIRRLQNPREIAALGKIVPADEMLELAFETSGRVKSIYFREGQKVQGGDPLIVLDAALEDNQLKALEAQLERNRLEQEDARAQQKYYEEVLEQQGQTYQRLKRSVEAKALPASELDRIELDITNSRNQAAAAARLLQRLEVQARELRIQQEEVRLRRRQKELTAPGEGTIVRWEVRQGATLNAYQLAGEFAPAGPLLVEAEVDEYFATDVKVGQKAIIRREGYTDTLAVGQVVFTSEKLSDKSILSEDNSQFEDLQVRRIKIRLEDGSRLLLGMKVEALIQTNEKS
ncbi:MAG: efflux RND transporter periplasmic adaptor subunit [Phaeodactylibacter sp.]|nr:efflux RND transporter periplasmic adaptor subunit [Phaeodactylibacter sp.]MCB9265212.1 efflux RND transporter periplasmic adaptor subunit [Lewinellaceae bacterium]MCB9285926.1 efflux RND transporter periplasmic adaptor subunit [Lewinellaceae bacterium]